MKVDQVYCVNNYWLDYPRRDRVVIEKCKALDAFDKREIRSGKSISKPDRGGTYTQYFEPIKYDDIRD